MKQKVRDISDSCEWNLEDEERYRLDKNAMYEALKIIEKGKE